MSDKESIIQLLDKIPDYKIRYVLAYIQGITVDEEADDIFCPNLLRNSLFEEYPELVRGSPRKSKELASWTLLM